MGNVADTQCIHSESDDECTCDALGEEFMYRKGSRSKEHKQLSEISGYRKLGAEGKRRPVMMRRRSSFKATARSTSKERLLERKFVLSDMEVQVDDGVAK